MASVWSILNPPVETAVAAARAAGYPPDSIGRTMLGMAIDLLRQDRPIEDVRRELEAALENLDPDQDYTFMRP